MQNNQHSEVAPTAGGSAPSPEQLVTEVIGGQSSGGDRRAQSLWTLGLALLAFAVHIPALFAAFVYDDVVTIEQRAGVDWSRLPGFFTVNQSAIFGSNFYRPVLSIYYEVLYGLFGTNPAAWHLAAILLHVACTLLVFRLALALVQNRSVAWTAAALFGVHPAHVETISWASAMGDPLLTLFMLLSVLCFLRWMAHGKLIWWGAAFASGAACVFTKETAVVLPFVLLATVLALRSRAKVGLPVLAATIPFFVITVVFLGARQIVLRTFSHPLNHGSTAQMIFTWPSVLLFDLHHMIWPPVVVPYYPLSIVQSWNSSEFFVPLMGITIAVAVLGYLLGRSAGWRRACVCAVWILAPLAPALYLKAQAPFELVQDRFLYAPLVGFCIAVTLIVRWMTEHIEARIQRNIFPLVALALIPLLSIATMSQMVWWQNNKTLFTRAVSVTPDCPSALVNLADADIAAQRYDQAMPLLQHAISLDPQNGNALFCLGRIAWLTGDDAAAEKYLTQAVRFHPRYDIWLHLASVDLHLNRVQEAEVAVRQALAMNPTGVGGHLSLGAVLLTEGDRSAAAREFQEELRLFPQSEAAQAGLARVTRNP